MIERKSGLLLALSSLPSDYGMGGFGRQAFDFIDYLKRAGQSYWQILPLGPTGYGNSPYSSLSTQAGSPLYIDLEDLEKRGLISKEELEAAKTDANKVDYQAQYETRMPLLKKAFSRLDSSLKEEIYYYMRSKPWLDDFALYMCIKELQGQVSWLDWEEDYKFRDSQALNQIRQTHKEAYDFWVFTQFIFEDQLKSFLAYADENSIEIIGDIPFYVAEDSVEVWVRPELFLLGEEGFVAGTPPDFFTDEGQLWGNPIYNWQLMEEEDFSWWTDRLRAQAGFYHKIRLDHFNAFARYWKIPKGASSKEGVMVEGYGRQILSRLSDLAWEGRLIAEDLGTETAAAELIRWDYKIPGMRILQVGFSPGEDNPHLPHSYDKDLFAYTGTHDNEPIMAWFLEAPERVKEDVRAYLNTSNPQALDFVRLLMASPAQAVIIPLQDLMGLGMEARMNLPGSLEDNWTWRLLDMKLIKPYEEILRNYSATYRRNL